MKIWKPRSRRKPSTVSVRTRPPTASDDSRMRNGMLLELRWVAAAKPARPAPIMMTPVLGREEGVVESCEEDLGLNLNLNGFGEEERDGFVEGKESVMIVIGVLDKAFFWVGGSLHLFPVWVFDSGGRGSFIGHHDSHACVSIHSYMQLLSNPKTIGPLFYIYCFN